MHLLQRRESGRCIIKEKHLWKERSGRGGRSGCTPFSQLLLSSAIGGCVCERERETEKLGRGILGVRHCGMGVEGVEGQTFLTDFIQSRQQQWD